MRFSAPLTVLLCTLCLASSAMAQGHSRHRHRGDHETARAALAQGEVLPLSRILAIAAERAPGDVIAVELESERGVLLYEIKVLNKTGRVIVVELDAKTGRILDVEND